MKDHEATRTDVGAAMTVVDDDDVRCDATRTRTAIEIMASIGGHRSATDVFERSARATGATVHARRVWFGFTTKP